jgi:hypothetical protein
MASPENRAPPSSASARESKEPFEQQCTYHDLNVKLAAISDVLPPVLVSLSQRA